MVALTCFGITLPSSGSVPSAFWEMLNWGAVDRILWMGVLCLVTWCTHHVTRLFLLGIFIFKGIAAWRLYKSFGFKGLIQDTISVLSSEHWCYSMLLHGLNKYVSRYRVIEHTSDPTLPEQESYNTEILQPLQSSTGSRPKQLTFKCS
jgi:hypothetical protein